MADGVSADWSDENTGTEYPAAYWVLVKTETIYGRGVDPVENYYHDIWSSQASYDAGLWKIGTSIASSPPIPAQQPARLLLYAALLAAGVYAGG